MIAADAVGASEIAADAVGSSELADNAVDSGAIATNAVTDAKLAAALADNLAITNGSSTRRGSAIDATERTTTSTSYVDVTNMSVTFHVATGSISLIYVAFEAKASNFGFCNVRGLIGSSTIAFSYDDGSPPTGAASAVDNIGGFGTSYALRRQLGFVNSATSGTGAQTVKLQFSVENNSGATGYIKNCQLFAFNYTL